MAGHTIEITMPDGVAEAYISAPDTGTHPGVLLHIDAIGLRPQIQQMADRIASWGYVVMAPNAFYREGTAAELAPTADLRVPGAREKLFPALMARVQQHTPQRSDADLDAYLAALLARPEVRGPELGFTGYCIGGQLAVRAAGRRPDVIAAAGVFHAGGIVTDHQDSTHLLIGAARAEILAGHADRDPSNPAEAVAVFEAAMDAAHLTYTSAIYPDAPHGFTMADTSMYHEEACERHFAELRGLLDRAL